MSNTKVTIKYASGATRDFIASDKLEELINDGQMFSVSTMHSDIGVAEEVAVSKMYAGNPIAAIGNMIIMRDNAKAMLKDDESMNIVIDICNVCIKFISDETTSHQSGMSPSVNGFPELSDPLLCQTCLEVSAAMQNDSGDYLCSDCYNKDAH